MRRILLALTLFCMVSTAAGAQKIAFINTETILASLPEYEQAQQYLTSLADKYKATVEADVAEVDKLYRAYQSSKATLSASQRASREQEIISREKQAKEKQKIYFGEDGIMAKTTEELLTPIQTKVNNVIAYIAKDSGYDLVIDLSAATGVVYKKPGNDITQNVIERMGKTTE